MSRSISSSLRLAVAALLLLVSAPALGEERALDERAVVELVRNQNPELKAALFRLESVRQDVSGLVERYAPVIQLDGSASDITNPSLFILGINRSRVRRVDLAAELRKHFVWGTDVALRLGSSIYETENIRPPIAPVPTDGMVGGTGATAAGTFLFPRKLGPGYGVSAKLTLKQPLLRGFGRDVAEADLNAARAERTALEHTRDRVASERLRDALSAYWELWYADAALQIQRAAREVAQRQRDEAQMRVDTGSLAPVEVLAFETELAGRAEDVEAAQAERDRAALELARLLGGETASLRVDEALPGEFRPPPPSVLETRALAHSAEVQESGAALELARVRQRTASDAKRQRLDLESYVQLQGLSTNHPGMALTQFDDLHSVSGFVGLTYEAPVTSRAERAAAAKARADVDAAEQDVLAVRQRVLAEAHKAAERADAQERSVTLAQQTQAIAERQLEAEQARFRTGAGTTLQVIQAEDKVRAAQLRVARARANLAQTGLVVEHLTGQLLSRWAGR